MEPDVRSVPVPPRRGLLRRVPATHVPPQPRPGAVAMATLGVFGAVSLVGARTARQLRSLREAGAQVPPLLHDLDLDGTAPTRRVVVLGDSAAAGHGLPSADEAIARRLGRGLHARDGRRTEVRSAAIDGATTRDVLRHQPAAADGAELVVLGVGVNDAIHARSAAAVTSDLRRLVLTIRARAGPDTSLVLLSCPDLSVAPGLPAVVRPALGWRCRAIAGAQRAVARELGVCEVAIPRTALPPEVFGPDGFHPGVEGHARIARSVLAALGEGPA